MNDTLPVPEDGALMARLASGDRTAFAALYDQHGRAAYALALCLGRSQALAEELVEGAFEALWRSAHQFPAGCSIRTQILSLIHRQAMRRVRGARKNDPEHLSVDREGTRFCELCRLQTGLSRLPEEQWQVVELAYFGGYTYPEISRMLSLSPAIVKRRLRLGLHTLGRVPEPLTICGLACRWLEFSGPTTTSPALAPSGGRHA